MDRRGAFALVVVAGLMGCQDHGHSDAHLMAFVFEPGLRLPAAYSSLDNGGTTLKITTTMHMGSMEHDMSAAFEPLADGAGYRVWVKTGETWTDAGPIVPGTNFEASVNAPDAVSITIETSDDPEARSPDVVVEGEAGGTLTFGDLSATSFTPAIIEAEIGGDSVIVDYSGLPVLPAGFRYELWYVPADEMGMATGDAVSLGILPDADDGSFLVEGVSWPANYFLSLSIESPLGVAGRSELACYVAEHEHDGSGSGSHDH